MSEQRYEAVRAVLADGETVTDVAARFGVARKTVHDWRRKCEAGGIEGLGDGSARNFHVVGRGVYGLDSACARASRGDASAGR